MMMAGAALLLTASTGALASSVKDELNDRTVCRRQKGDPSIVECTSSLGKDLVVTIAGVGHPAASVVFVRSNENGDAFAKFQVGLGCVLIKRGLQLTKRDPPLFLDMAFISPRTGKVYGDGAACGEATTR